MAGCRSLTIVEQDKVLNCLTNQRDRALFLLAIYSGLRISELLSIRIKDVWSGNALLDRVKVRRMCLKGGRSAHKNSITSRDIPIHPTVRPALEALIMTLKNIPDSYLFQSRNHNRALSRSQAHNSLKAAFSMASVSGSGLSWHSTRKTFGQKIYVNSNHNIVLTQKALGHANLDSTAKYLEADRESVDSAILA
jgi:integrase